MIVAYGWVRKRPFFILAHIKDLTQNAGRYTIALLIKGKGYSIWQQNVV